MNAQDTGRAIARVELFAQGTLVAPDGRPVIAVSEYDEALEAPDGRPVYALSTGLSDGSPLLAASLYPAGTVRTDDGRPVYAVDGYDANGVRGALGSAAVAWPYSYAEAFDVVGIGSSTMAGGSGCLPAPLSWMQQDSTGGTYYAPGAAIPASGGVLIANRGAGGTTSATIETSFIAEGARVKASDIIVSIGGNYETATSPVSGIVTNCQDIVAAAGHNRFLFVPKHSDGADIAASGGLDWHRLRDIGRRLAALYPGRVTDAALWLRYGYTPRTGDQAAMDIGKAPPSLWGSNASPGTDTAHLNGDDAALGYTSGNHLLSRHVYAPWRRARNGGVPFVGHQTIFSTEATNQTNGGLVGTIQHDAAWHPSLAGVTVEIVGNANFSAAIESGAIKLRRATGTFLGDGFYILRLRTTLGGYYDDSFLRVFLCDTTPDGLYRANIASQMLVRERVSTDAVQDSQTFSMAIGLRPIPASGWDYVAVTNAVTHNLVRSDLVAGGGINLSTKASTNQNLGLTIKNSGSINVVNIDSNTAQGFREGAGTLNGLRWYFASINLVTGAGHVAVDANAASTGTATVGETMRLSVAGASIMEHFFGSTLGGGGAISNACPMELAALWMSVGYVSFQNPTGNRDLVRDPVTGRSLLGSTRGGDAPGYVGGAAPWRWFEGHAGNIAAGLNLANPAERWDCSDRVMLTSVAA